MRKIARDGAEIFGFIDIHISNVSIAIGFIVPVSMSIWTSFEERGVVFNEDMVMLRDDANKKCKLGREWRKMLRRAPFCV